MKMYKRKQNSATNPVKLSYPLLYVQALLTIVMLILGVITIFNHTLLNWFELFLGFTLLDIALNNALFYKRNGGTFLYSILGVVLVLLAFLEMAGF